MLGLIKSTELSKQLPKKSIYAKFALNSAEKSRFDSDISRITIVNELSDRTIAIKRGDSVNSIFVLLVNLKSDSYSEKTISMIPRIIDQKMILILQYENKSKLAVYYKRLYLTEWIDTAKLSIDIKGLDLNQVWENVVVQISGITIEHGNTLEGQITENNIRENIQNEINKLEKQAKKEIQPKKKYEIVQKINSLKELLEGK